MHPKSDFASSEPQADTRSESHAPMSDPITDVVFDLGHVLIDWDPRYLYRARFAGDERAMEHFLAHVCSPQWHLEIDRGLSWERAIAECSARHPEHAEHIRAYRSGWEQMFAGEVPGTVALLEALVAVGTRLHALSNYPAEPVDFLYHRYPWMNHFEHVVITGLLGRAKPELKVFLHLLERIERPAQRCLFIDDRADNVAAAAALGFDVIRFSSASELAAALRARRLLPPA
jgi:2-haloacid dehalogenase